MDSSFRANIVHLHQTSGVGALEHALGRTAAEYQLHTLNLPPSPQSLDMHQPGPRAQSFQPSHPSVLTPLHSSLGSRSPSPPTWQLCSHNTPAQHPASPVSLDGFDASPRDYPRAADYQRYPSPLLADDFAASDDQLYPALMASNGLGTPPGSINGSSTELDRQPSIFLHGSAPMPGDYLAPVPHVHAYGVPPYSRDAHGEAANPRGGMFALPLPGLRVAVRVHVTDPPCRPLALFALHILVLRDGCEVPTTVSAQRPAFAAMASDSPEESPAPASRLRTLAVGRKVLGSVPEQPAGEQLQMRQFALQVRRELPGAIDVSDRRPCAADTASFES